MTPEAAKALIDRVKNVEGSLPFDLCVAWEEHGVEAWVNCDDPQSMLSLLVWQDHVQGVRAALQLARSQLSQVDRVEARPDVIEALEAAEGWLDAPLSGYPLSGWQAEAERAAARLLRYEYRYQGPAMRAIRAAGLAAQLAASTPRSRAVSQVFFKWGTRDEDAWHCKVLRTHFDAPTTDALITATW